MHIKVSQAAQATRNHYSDMNSNTGEAARLPSDSASNISAEGAAIRISNNEISTKRNTAGGPNISSSALMNGNYKISALYNTNNNELIVIAASQDGQVMTATINRSDLSALSFGKSYNLDLSSGSDAKVPIHDVAMAREMTVSANASLTGQAPTSLRAQANALPERVLSLIK